MSTHGKPGARNRRCRRRGQSIALLQHDQAGITREHNGSSAITPAIEDYVKIIAHAQHEQQRITTNLVAARMDVSAASVTRVFQRLQQLGLIVYTPYYGATLTEAGQHLADDVLRRNQLVTQFLINVLGCTSNDVEADADALEHVISDTLEERIAAYLGWPEQGDG